MKATIAPPKPREVDIVVISDIHLGTYGCHAEELMQYLQQIKPGILILNGDIVDAWQFKKRYFPPAHLAVVSYIIKMAASGIPVYYIAGNHDEFLRRFTPFHLGDFHLDNKAVLEVNGKKIWIFHGDVFDNAIRCSRWLAKLGGKGYDFLILFNRMVNQWLVRLGRPRISLSQKIKRSVKSAIKYIGDFEKTAADLAMEHGYDYVICGHIHQPAMREVTGKNGKNVMYLNSGDWVESLTSLEYHNGNWRIYKHEEQKNKATEPVVYDEIPGYHLLELLIQEELGHTIYWKTKAKVL